MAGRLALGDRGAVHLENLIDHVGRDARAVVRDRDQHRVGPPLYSDDHR